MKKTIHAFTLVELLVVIVIIGILAGIALPVFQKAQEKARAISDQSNLRQLGIGIQAYKGDNDGDMLGAASWPQKLNPTYVSSWKVFKSPFDARPASETATSAPISYGINNESGTGGKVLGADSSKFNYPTSLVLLAPAVDMVASDVRFPGTNLGNVDVFVTAPAAGDKDKGTHSSRKRVNVLFADGHTEDILWVKFMDKTTPDGLKRWVYDTP